jgi:polyhydroxyalkanoate synthesis regulator phasin
MRDEAGIIRTSDNLEMQAEMRSLYRHLVERGKIRQLEGFDEGVLHIFSREVLQRIKNGDDSWEEMVPSEIAEIIKRRRLFGCQAVASMESPLPQ